MRTRIFNGIVVVLLTCCAIRDAAAADVARDKYVLFCAGCHGMDGEGGGGEGGTKKIFPFVPSVGVFLNDPNGRWYLANVGGVTSAGMTASETAQVLNYILTVFGKASLPRNFIQFTAAEMESMRKVRADDPLAIRRGIAARLSSQKIPVPPYEWD